MGNDRYQDYTCIDFLRRISGLKGSITKEKSLLWDYGISKQSYLHIIKTFSRKLEEIVEAVHESRINNNFNQKEAVYRKVIEAYQHLIK